MIHVEVQESEAFAKLAEYEASAHLNDSDHINQAANKLKLSVINSIGEVNYYQIIQSEEYTHLLGVIKTRVQLVGGVLPSGYRNKFRKTLQQTYIDEQRFKRKLQRVWFGRGGWALRGA